MHRCIAVIALSLFVTCAASAQWPPRSVEIPTSGSALTISAANVPAGGRWIVGVKAGDVTQPTVAASAARIPRIGQVGPRRPEFADLSAGELSLSADSLSLPADRSPDTALLVYVTVPRGKRVTIIGPDGVVMTAPVVESAIVDSGRVVLAPLTGAHQLLLMVVSGLYPQKTGADSALDTLRRSLIRYTDIGYLGQPVKPGTIYARLKIVVNQAGAVESLSGFPITASPAYSDAIRSWRFAAQPKALEATILVVVADDGHLVSALSPGARVF